MQRSCFTLRLIKFAANFDTLQSLLQLSLLFAEIFLYAGLWSEKEKAYRLSSFWLSLLPSVLVMWCEWGQDDSGECGSSQVRKKQAGRDLSIVADAEAGKKNGWRIEWHWRPTDLDFQCVCTSYCASLNTGVLENPARTRSKSSPAPEVGHCLIPHISTL